MNKVFGKSNSNPFAITEDTFLFLQVVLQHHGFPTRILDWTYDYRIALYFCLEDTSQDGDISIWAIKKEKVLDVEDCISNNNYLTPVDMYEDNKLIKFYQRLKPGVYSININNFERIKAQKGITLVTGASDYMDFQDHLNESKNLQKNDIIKINVDKSIRPEISEYLLENGITKESLYPDDITDGSLSYDKKRLEDIMLKTYINWNI